VPILQKKVKLQRREGKAWGEDLGPSLYMGIFKRFGRGRQKSWCYQCFVTDIIQHFWSPRTRVSHFCALVRDPPNFSKTLQKFIKFKSTQYFYLVQMYTLKISLWSKEKYRKSQGKLQCPLRFLFKFFVCVFIWKHLKF